ncbi:MAG: ureidoglycolate lyase [Spirochaetota bacterium]|nr:ureidoglycolate lyase [Spirochaetota bacterium]
MKTINPVKLTLENFSPYGYFSKMQNPGTIYFGTSPVKFYRDIIQLPVISMTNVSFSICQVEKRDFVIQKIECHSHCYEGILPLDGDVLIHVAHATQNNVYPYDDIRVFLVPQYTMVVLKAGVWHHAPFAVNSTVNTLIILPERTYANDCIRMDIPEEFQLKILV